MAVKSIATAASDPPPPATRALVIVLPLFFIWGLVTALNDILIPHLRSVFDLTYAEAMLVRFSYSSAYFAFSWPSGRLLARMGYKRTMVMGLFTVGAGAWLFIPAAAVPAFPLFLGALVVLGAGITALQVSANLYVTVLGPQKTASSRLNMTQAFKSLGTTIAPYFGSIFILKDNLNREGTLGSIAAQTQAAYRLHEASSVKLPYFGLGLTVICLGILIAVYKVPMLPIAERRSDRLSSGSNDRIWKHRHLILGVIAIFLYVGAEAGIAGLLVNYLMEPNIGNVSAPIAARYVSVYWGGALIGRLAGSVILQKIDTSRVLGVAAIAAFLLVATSMVGTGQISMWSILLVGLFNSIMFANIFSLATASLGLLIPAASSALVMAIGGGAVLPLLAGFVADHLGIKFAFVLPAVSYLYVLFYALKGSKCPDVPIPD
jgi:MFS transporter, FHS family, L-fucose permease